MRNWTKLRLVVSVMVLICVKVNSADGIMNGNGKMIDPTSAAFSKDTLSVKGKDLKVEESRANDPPPEYYRGPSSSLSYDRDSDRYGLNRPYGSAAPVKYGSYSSTGAYGSNTYGNNYDSRYPTSTPGYNRDRIGSSGYTSGGSYYSNIAPYDGNSYGSTDTSYHSGLNYGSNPYPNGFSIIDSGHYWGNEGGQEYDSYGQKKGLSKSVLLPIAGVALLGIAAALAANPVLLQLGAVGKRRKRDLTHQLNVERRQDAAAQRLAYNGHIVRR